MKRRPSLTRRKSSITMLGKKAKMISSIFRSPVAKDNSKALLDILDDVALLSPLSLQDKEELTKSLKPKTFLPGQDLMVQGEEGDEFHIISKARLPTPLISP